MEVRFGLSGLDYPWVSILRPIAVILICEVAAWAASEVTMEVIFGLSDIDYPQIPILRPFAAGNT